MMRTARKAVFVSVCLAATPIASRLGAQPPRTPQTPKNWPYEVDQFGNRITRSNRTVNADGSWREEIRQGNCLTVRERSATGEYRETRQCNAAKPR